MTEGEAATASPRFLPECRWNLVQFGLVCSYTMGITAMWRFPYLVYKHTGLFLVAYYTLLVVICVPVCFIQLKLGSTLQRGVVGIFSHFMPALKGVAVAVLCVTFIQCVYHGVYISYGLYYMLTCVRQPYYWTYLGNATKTHQASSSYVFIAKTSAEHHYYNDFLQRTSGLEDPGTVPWYLVVSLLGTWVLTYILVCRGPSLFGKIVYVSSPLAIVVLFAVLIYSHTSIPKAYHALGHFFSDTRRNTLENGHGHTDASDILKSELASPLTWIRALEQHIFSVGLWTGLLPTLGNHVGNKKPASNLTWLIVLLVHSMLPHLGTIAIAPFIHALAVDKKMPFEDVINSGSYLMFVVLPEAFDRSNVSAFWSFLFYFMLVLFALHQQAVLLIVIVENIAERLADYTRIVFRRVEFLTAALCTFAFCLGLPHVTQGGSYLTELVDVYLYQLLCILVILFAIPMALAHAKIEPLHIPLERLFMSGWFVVGSLGASGLLVYNYCTFVKPVIAQKDFATWMQILGWLIAVSPSLVCIIAGFIHAIYKGSGPMSQRIKTIWKISEEELPCSEEPEYPDMDMNGTLPYKKTDSLRKKKKLKNMNQNAMNGGIASMAAEAAAKAQNSPALQRATAGLTSSDAPMDEIREVEVEVAIDAPISNGHVAQV